MLLHIEGNRHIGDVQKEFNNAFPFLKLEFYHAEKNNRLKPKHFLSSKSSIRHSTHKSLNDTLYISNSMTVSELENKILALFGLGVQVYRKSGNLWLETTMTDNWTLQKQNEHGRELSVPLKNGSSNED